MAAARHNHSGLLPATAPGVAALSDVITALTWAPAVQLPDEAPQEVLVGAQRQTDAVAYSERGADAAGSHSCISADHTSAVTRHGIVRL
jgi:hypothetical protein